MVKLRLSDSRFERSLTRNNKVEGSDARWLCITKQPNGEFALFKLVAKDLLDSISDLIEASPDQCFRGFSRVRTWIDFLRLEKRGMSQNAQVGLFGELMVIQRLKVLGMSSREVASAWIGPSRALHISNLQLHPEVKTSLNKEKMILLTHQNSFSRWVSQSFARLCGAYA